MSAKVDVWFGFEQLPVAAVIADAGGTVLAANPAADAAGLPAAGAKIWAGSPQLAAWWPDLVHDVSATDVEVETRHGNRVMRIALATRVVDSKVVVFAGMVDITQRIGRLAEQHERAEASQRLESLGLVAGGVAHEFNNQLVGVVSEASMLREDEALTDDTREAVHRIDAAARRMSDLTRQLVAFAGVGRFETTKLDPDALVIDTRARLSTIVPPSVALALELTATGGRISVEADRSLLRQVILELVSNANDAVGLKGTIQVVTRRIERGAAPWWELEIHDDGVGMDEGTRARMFDPFFSTKIHHAGLGLAAVLGIVRRLGGDLAVTSAVGFGTTVRVRLPIVVGVAPTARRTSELPAIEQLTGLSILVADDESIVRNTIRRALARRGAAPVLASDGLEAEQLMATQRFDVVMFDVAMPGKGGYELVPVARGAQPGVPVILMSGYAEQTGADAPDAFIEKPFTVSQLETTILNARRGVRAE